MAERSMENGELITQIVPLGSSEGYVYDRSYFDRYDELEGRNGPVLREKARRQGFLSTLVGVILGIVAAVYLDSLGLGVILILTTFASAYIAQEYLFRRNKDFQREWRLKAIGRAVRSGKDPGTLTQMEKACAYDYKVQLLCDRYALLVTRWNQYVEGCALKVIVPIDHQDKLFRTLRALRATLCHFMKVAKWQMSVAEHSEKNRADANVAELIAEARQLHEELVESFDGPQIAAAMEVENTLAQLDIDLGAVKALPAAPAPASP